MAHIVFLISSYYPKFEAVGICARNVVNELKKNNKITVICKKTYFNQENSEEYEETQIVRIQTKYDNYRLYLILKSDENNRILKRLLRFIIVALRVFGYLNVIFSKVIMERDVVRAYLNILEKVHREDKIDILIPCSGRFENCLAAAKFRRIHDGVKLVPYMFDNYASNITLYRNSKFFYRQKHDRHVALERFVYNESDIILCVKHYADSYTINHRHTDKLLIVEHPLIFKITNEKKFNFDKNKINIVYTGSLYRKIRNPKYALTVLSKIIESQSEIVVHLFTLGDSSRLVGKFVKKFPNQFIHHGCVSNDIAETARNGADYLLSIGNTSNNQIPSKTLKPIIHFSKFKHDQVSTELAKYPNSCILMENIDSMDVNISELNHFLEVEKVGLSIEVLKQLFPSADPSDTAKKIEKLVLKS